MRPNLLLIAALTLAWLTTMCSLPGCEGKSPASVPAEADDHAHDHGHDGGHDATEPSAPGHGGAVIALGEQTIGTFTAKATRDEGQIVAGKDAPIDVTITPIAAATTKAAAVRFWIGTQDAKGSVKARAEVENPRDPGRWHVHAEIPDPMPEGSRLWVEIEDSNGGTSLGSFDLKH